MPEIEEGNEKTEEELKDLEELNKLEGDRKKLYKGVLDLEEAITTYHKLITDPIKYKIKVSYLIMGICITVIFMEIYLYAFVSNSPINIIFVIAYIYFLYINYTNVISLKGELQRVNIMFPDFVKCKESLLKKCEEIEEKGKKGREEQKS